MNEEIKEILDNKLYFDLEEEDYIKIKNYITNLQQERDMYKTSFETMSQNYFEEQQENERLKEEYVLLQNASEEYEDKLQTKIDKAIEYIEKEKWYSNVYFENIINSDNLLNILQNGSDSQ